MPAADAARLCVLTSFPHEAPAGMVVAALEREGIPAEAVGGNAAALRLNAYGWVQVLVREADLPRAQELLERIARDAEPVDWSAVDTGDPVDAP